MEWGGLHHQLSPCLIHQPEPCAPAFSLRYRNPALQKQNLRNKRTLKQLSVVKGRTTAPLELEQKWEGNPMSTCQQTESARSNQFTESSICDHCAGVTIHEPWCLTCNTVVRYAFEAASDTGHLTLGDELILHALGVEWGRKGL